MEAPASRARPWLCRPPRAPRSRDLGALAPARQRTLHACTLPSHAGRTSSETPPPKKQCALYVLCTHAKKGLPVIMCPANERPCLASARARPVGLCRCRACACCQHIARAPNIATSPPSRALAARRRRRMRTPWLQGMRRRRRAANARCRHPARAPEFWGPVGMVRRERAQAAAPLASPAWRHFLDALLSGRSRRRRWWKARDGELRDEHNFGTLACWRQHGVAAGAAAVGGSAAGVEALAAAAAGRCRCSR